MAKAVTHLTGPLDIIRKTAYGENDPHFDYNTALRKMTPLMLQSDDVAVFADMDSTGMGRAWESDIGDLCTTEEWLRKYSLKRFRLDIDCILGAIGFRHISQYEKMIKKPICSRYADGLFSRYTTSDGKAYNLIATKDKLQQFERRLVQLIDLYSRRLEFLTTESRRTFGVVAESSVCLVLNLCTQNASLFSHYLAIVRAVLRQQLNSKGRINLIRVSDIVDSWQPHSVPVTRDIIEDAINWLDTLSSGARCSATAVAEAVMKASGDKRLDAIYLFTGGDDLSSAREILLQQSRFVEVPINVVAFNVFDQDALHYLRELAASSNGRFHAYTINWCVEDYEINPALLNSRPTPQSMNKPVVSKKYLYGGVPAGAGVREDTFRLYEEIEQAKNNLSIVQSIMRDLPENRQAEINMEKQRKAQKRQESANRMVMVTDEEYLSSAEWLKKFGLRSRKLDMYDVLSSVAFRHCDGVVDVGTTPGSMQQTDAVLHSKLVNAK